MEHLELERRKMIDRGEIVSTEIERPTRPDEVTVISSYVESVSAADNNSNDFLNTIRTEDDVILTSDGVLISQEYFQLMPVEAFFLSYSLGVLTVSEGGKTLASVDLFNRLLVNQNFFQFDDKFILEYVVYHHYRSLGWCVRGGVKFGVDFMLYKRGPPFSHAEFAVLVIPCYNDEITDNSLRKDWWWNTNISRIIGGVKKTLVFCYVEIPKDTKTLDNEGLLDVTGLLSRYRVREIVYRRWLPSRNRD
ncbi:tRNA-intron endonuclease catalytic domain-like protein [Nadsonia fulvescens var. elongata DSM 6958]|uniref:tRNA-splicing endonuclease subunit Sen2 n=1 Tax=Nadsonia fulvescens var. elongata DSM 6958 TaxID=857566 RepID=A0A1E3PRH4_9ASCO|nr:tRNA-intron endonuclease catalytic domain-like protein [Nadsonia fulvescens var. elongata DSM 6958]